MLTRRWESWAERRIQRIYIVKVYGRLIGRILRFRLRRGLCFRPWMGSGRLFPRTNRPGVSLYGLFDSLNTGISSTKRFSCPFQCKNPAVVPITSSSGCWDYSMLLTSPFWSTPIQIFPTRPIVCVACLSFPSWWFMLSLFLISMCLYPVCTQKF